MLSKRQPKAREDIAAIEHAAFADPLKICRRV
jgi:hypothetical protein